MAASTEEHPPKNFDKLFSSSSRGVLAAGAWRFVMGCAHEPPFCFCDLMGLLTVPAWRRCRGFSAVLC